MSLRPFVAITFLAAQIALGQDAPAAPPPAPAPNDYTVDMGTKVPLTLINSISTKHSQAGDRVYLETAFPILANGRIVIPVGSYVAGTVTEVKKPGRVKGRGELYIRFDSLTLPNGVTREFRARMGGMDAGSIGELDRAEGTVKSEGNKAGDVRTIGETAAAGASVGGIAGSIASHPMMGVGVGAAAGAAAGLIYVLTSRGPDAVVAKGSTIEMVLDRSLNFQDGELNFPNTPPQRVTPMPVPSAQANKGVTVPPR